MDVFVRAEVRERMRVAEWGLRGTQNTGIGHRAVKHIIGEEVTGEEQSGGRGRLIRGCAAPHDPENTHLPQAPLRHPSLSTDTPLLYLTVSLPRANTQDTNHFLYLALQTN